MKMNIFGAYEEDETLVFVDGRNSFLSGSAAGFDLDFLKVREYLQETCRLIRAHYFTTVDINRDASIGSMLHLFNEKGFTIFTKEIEQYQDGRGTTRLRGNCNVEIACAMVLGAVKGAQHLILFSGNSDLAAAIEHAKDEGCRTTVVSTMAKDQNGNPICSTLLANAADEFVDYCSLRDLFWRRDRIGGSDYENSDRPTKVFSPAVNE